MPKTLKFLFKHAIADKAFRPFLNGDTLTNVDQGYHAKRNGEWELQVDVTLKSGLTKSYSIKIVEHQ